MKKIKMEKIKMKQIVYAVLTGILFLCMTGCYEYIAEHPEKSKTQFYEDQAECEKKARAYAQEMRVDWSDNDDLSYGRSVNAEISDARRCMGNKGWKYIFRK